MTHQRASRSLCHLLAGTLVALLSGCFTDCAPTETAENAAPVGADRGAHKDERFNQLLSQHTGKSYDDLLSSLPARSFRKKLSFEPAEVEYAEQAMQILEVTARERELFAKNGFV